MDKTSIWRSIINQKTKIKMAKQKSQVDRILEYLSKGKTLSESEALSRFGTRNLRATVNNLRNYGYEISTTQTKTSKKLAYKLG